VAGGSLVKLALESNQVAIRHDPEEKSDLDYTYYPSRPGSGTSMARRLLTEPRLAKPGQT
jgi:hypothetical protein